MIESALSGSHWPGPGRCTKLKEHSRYLKRLARRHWRRGFTDSHATKGCLERPRQGPPLRHEHSTWSAKTERTFVLKRAICKITLLFAALLQVSQGAGRKRGLIILGSQGLRAFPRLSLIPEDLLQRTFRNTKRTHLNKKQQRNISKEHKKPSGQIKNVLTID